MLKSIKKERKFKEPAIKESPYYKHPTDKGVACKLFSRLPLQAAEDAVFNMLFGFTYDKSGRRTGYDDGTTAAVYTYDALGRQTGGTVDYGAFSLDYGYTYDAKNDRKTFVAPDGDNYFGGPEPYYHTPMYQGIFDTYVGTNLRFGCTILKYYLDLEKGDLKRALGRYNGSLGERKYPNLVLDKLRLKWYRV